MSTFIEKIIIEKYLLQGAIDWRNANNPTSPPYHNNVHMDYMLEDCMEWFIYSRVTRDSQSSNTTVDFNPRCLFLAAIFHDFGHSGGHKSDAENIEDAISGWYRFCDSNETNIMCVLRPRVALLIRSTQYPYLDLNVLYSEYPVMDGNTFLMCASVLRDADLMTRYHGEFGASMIVHELWKEISVAYPNMDYNGYIEGQKKFNKSITWLTPWAIHKATLLDSGSLSQSILDKMAKVKQEGKKK